MQMDKYIIVYNYIENECRSGKNYNFLCVI